ncbi:C40 family peptidase [Gynurincola endophyticus]|uniref:C40 family peptidase n=1 Tax=Gynurincola endophyticus TaxID=2479004 RepID=UPI000F8CE934|nr:C40 family peptidase [Gynurincola endophyticus]
MAIAYTCSTVVPMRSVPAHSGETVSQMLLLEGGEVLEETDDFVKVKAFLEGYEGWVARNQLVIVKEPLAGLHTDFVLNDINVAMINQQRVVLPVATPVPQQKKIELGNYSFDFSSLPQPENRPQFQLDEIKKVTYRMLNTPYLWGGRSSFGIDCSGFTQYFYRYFGLILPRDAYQQVEKGETIGFLQESKPGDLAYFDNEKGRIVHVGILLDSETIIHASGLVRIDQIDSEGIVHKQWGKRTHKLRTIKRIIN